MLGSLIGAASSVIGGLFGKSSQEKAQKKEYQRQKEFAQSGVQWKVEDAKKAGIHPLYALGANTTSYSPQSVGGTDYGIAEAGQNLGRAIQTTRSAGGKAEALSLTAAQLQNEGLAIDNDIKRAQLASSMAVANQPGQSAGIPPPDARWLVDGQGNAALPGDGNKYERKIAPPEPGQQHMEAGASPEVTLYKTVTGGYAPQIPQSLSEPFEQDWLSYYQWMARNKIAPGFSSAYMSPPLHVPLAPGHEWDYSIPGGQYYQRKILKRPQMKVRKW